MVSRQNIDNAESHKKGLEKMIWKYLWRNSAPLVKRSVCVSAIDSGGCSFPHIEAKMTAIRCSRFKKILDPQSSSMIKRYAILWLSKISGIYKMESTFLVCQTMNNLPEL